MLVFIFSHVVVHHFCICFHELWQVRFGDHLYGVLAATGDVAHHASSDRQFQGGSSSVCRGEGEADVDRNSHRGVDER